VNRLRLITIGALAFVALLPAQARTQGTMLVATVGTGDSSEINLLDASGNRVTQLDPGTYTIAVRDRSVFHNFHLTGPGVDMATTEEFVGEVTWTVTVTDGQYRYVCDPHATTMRGSFTVGQVAPPADPVALAGVVGPKRSIDLRGADGTRVTSLAAGRVVLTVRDRTKKDNFHLTGPGVNRKTGVGFRGTATWTLTLAAGTYTYRSDKTRKLRRSFTVTG